MLIPLVDRCRVADDPSVVLRTETEWEENFVTAVALRNVSFGEAITCGPRRGPHEGVFAAWVSDGSVSHSEDSAEFQYGSNSFTLSTDTSMQREIFDRMHVDAPHVGAVALRAVVAAKMESLSLHALINRGDRPAVASHVERIASRFVNAARAVCKSQLRRLDEDGDMYVGL